MFLKYNQLSILWTIVVTVLCFIPSKQIPDQQIIPGFDKIVHFGMFFLLSYLWMIGLIKQRRFKKIRPHAVAISMIFALIYGVFIELFQNFMIETRDGEWLDMLANSLGVLGSYYFFKIIYGKNSDYAS